LLTASLWAQQSPFGRINGRVADPTGASVPNAVVAATNIGTNVPVSAKTNGDGNYALVDLNPGQYRLTVTVPGFKKFDRGPIEVRVGDILDIPVKLEVGAQTETVTVTGDTPLLETSSASVGQVIETRRVMDLPTPQGNPTYLLQMVPNVITTNAVGATWTPDGQDQASDFVTAGSPRNQGEYSIDGMANMMAGGTMAVVPPPEMIQEFKVETAAYDASQGHAEGSFINMVMKSGTNAFHGVLVYTNVSRPLTTHTFFINQALYNTATGPPTSAKANQLWPSREVNRYRGTVGGPVVFPKLYNGKNRTFWQFGFDLMRMPYPNVGPWTVPTAAERNGDFSALLALGNQYQIYDPATIMSVGNGRYSRAPFPNNIIPMNRLDPLALKLLQYYPLPNSTGTATGLNNYNGAPNQRVNYDSYYARADQQISSSQKVFFSYNQSHVLSHYTNIFGNPATGTIFNGWWHNVALNDVWTLGNNKVLTMRASLMRFDYTSAETSEGYNLASLGLPASLVNQLNPSLTTIPGISIDGGQFTGLGGGGVSFQAQTFPTFAANVAHLIGKHSLNYGGEFRIFLKANDGLGNVSPAYTFNPTYTNGPLDNSPAAPLGQGLAQFLLGIPSTGSIDRNTSFAEAGQYLGTFLQDDWKLSSKLTIDMGLRYEVEFPTTERYNRFTTGFDFADANPIQAAAQANYAASPIPQVPVGSFSTRGGLLFAGVGGQPTTLYNIRTHNFLPRIGIAWQPIAKTVIRTGYGIFFGQLTPDRVDVSQPGFSQTTTLVPTTNNGLSFTGTLDNPFPNGLLVAPGASQGLTSLLGQSITINNPNRKEGYVQRWNFDIQRELPGRVVVQIGYTGNRGTGLPTTQSLDAIPAKYLSTQTSRDQNTINTLTAQVANPFYNIPQFAGTSLSSSTVALSQLLMPYPQFTGISEIQSNGFSWYHGFSVSAQHRFNRGLVATASYTWSKYMQATEYLNAFDTQPTHVISPDDRPQHLGITGVYDLPFGHGRQYLSSSPGWVNQIIGGWSVDLLYTAQSGAPIAFGNVFYNGSLSSIVLPESQRSPSEWFNTAGFVTASNLQPADNIRTFPLRLTGVRAAPVNDVDLSLVKGFHIWENVNFELRANAKDAFNHALFAAPNTTPTSTLFGQVTAVSGAQQRTVEVGARLIW
jgi:hypothetical protein